MHLECARSKVHADRWREEVLLVTEEVHRTIYFLEWKANWWVERASAHADASSCVQRGISAYAAKQGVIHHAIAMSCAEQWYPILVKQHTPIQWPSKNIPTCCTTIDIDWFFHILQIGCLLFKDVIEYIIYCFRSLFLVGVMYCGNHQSMPKVQ